MFLIFNDKTDGDVLTSSKGVESERRWEHGGGDRVVTEARVRGRERAVEWFECYGD